MPEKPRPPDRSNPLTDDEIDLARELIESYRAARATGRAAKWMLVSLAMLAAGITAWDAVVGRLRGWLVQ